MFKCEHETVLCLLSGPLTEVIPENV